MKHCYIHKHNQKHAYDDVIDDLRSSPEIPCLYDPNDYHGEDIVKLCCTQHSHVVDLQETITDQKRRQITAQWAHFLSAKPLPLKHVQFCTYTPQSVLDAVCTQTTIETLRLKWLKCDTVGAIAKLQNLKKLFIEHAPTLTDITPLAKLSNLEVLILGGTTSLRDYSPLAKLSRLHTLIICSYQTRDDVITIQDDRFIENMNSLRYLDLHDTVILNRSYLNEHSASTLEYACFPL